ncbi:MAG: AmmeMemoRadiSam system radical SAM enzyme [Desulfatiglandaceae bacterium]|jgi:pyruvate formate lyase activating enzyme
MKEGYLYEKLDQDRVRCFLCNHQCLIKEGARGICGVRENQSGSLFTLVYDKVIAAHTDPIEKKPLFHFLPGTRSYSIATVGCNFRCLFCQNADISQMPSDHHRIYGDKMTPREIVQKAVSASAATISYTYTEPTIFFELALDTARSAANAGLKNIFVSNGYMSEDCLKEIHPDLHGANIDLKSFNDRFYREQCGAKLGPVLRNLATLVEMGVWLEVTTLIIPGLNDSVHELKSLARFLADLNPDIPWHISRFHPTYRLLNLPATPAETIHRACDVGYEAGLKYVYPGNIPGDKGEKTFCHGCGKTLIDRFGFQVQENSILNHQCPHCGETIPGVWD